LDPIRRALQNNKMFAREIRRENSAPNKSFLMFGIWQENFIGHKNFDEDLAATRDKKGEKEEDAVG